MQSDEQREFVERLHVLPPRGGDEALLAPPGMSSNTGPRSFPSSPLHSTYGTPQVPSQQDLSWPQALEDQSEWAFAPQALIEQPNQLVDRPPFGLLSPGDSLNTYPYSNGHNNSTIQNSTFLHGYPSPISPFSPLYDSQDRSLHYPNGLPASPHHLASSTQRFDRPVNPYYNQYNPIMGQSQSGSALEQNYSGYEELAMEMNASPRAEQQGRVDDSDQASQPEDTPYAQLIYQALMSVDNHQMILKDIYKWIAENTDKAADPEFTGWQNSVRHNLSMNHAFNKLPYTNPADKSKKGFIWALDPSAIASGKIQPTTRYRAKKDGEAPKPSSPHKPHKGRIHDIIRQRSGRRGGQVASRRAARDSSLQRHHRDARRDRDHHGRRRHRRNVSSSSVSSAYGSSPPSSSVPRPTAFNTRHQPAPFGAPAPLSCFEESEREDLVPFQNTVGLPELWIRAGELGFQRFGAGSGLSTPVTDSSDCFHTSEEEDEEGGYFGGGGVGGANPFVDCGVVKGSSPLLPATTATTAATTPFMMGMPAPAAAGVAGADVGDGGDEMGGYLADEEEGLNGLPGGEEVGGWEVVEGMGYEDHEQGGLNFEQAFDVDGEGEGGFLG